MVSRFLLKPVCYPRSPFIQNLIYQAALSRPGYTCDAYEFPQGKIHIYILKVILTGTLYGNLHSVSRSALPWHIYLLFSGKVLSRNGLFAGLNILYSSLSHQFSAVDSRSRTDINNVVCGVHGILIVLHHYKGVSYISQMAQSLQQFFVILLMETDAGFVKYIQHSHKT